MLYAFCFRLVSVSLSPLRLVFWNSVWSGCITFISMCINEGLQGFQSLSRISTQTQVSLIASIVAAVALNITQWYAMKALGALMSSIVGNLNLILVIALSTAYLHETVTPPQYLGALLLAAGTFANKAKACCHPKLPEKTSEGPAAPKSSAEAEKSK